MNLSEFDPDVIVDARECIMGRVASQVAQMAMDGERVAVVNAEGAVITGDEEDVVGTYRKRTELRSDKGPMYPKRPDGIMKRSIKGMLPHKKTSGREALANVRVYVGNPFDEDAEPLDDTSLDRLSNIRFVHLGEISEQIGAKVTW